MRLNLRTLTAAILVATAAPAFAQFNESFEPVQGQQSTRDALIQQHWLFPDMDVNQEGTSPITGNQSMGTGPSYKPDQNTGFVTPFLNFSNNETLEFNYQIHRAALPTCRRWFMVYLADTMSNGYLIDSVEVDPTSTSLFSYSTNINNWAGTYCIYVNFKGDGCNAKFVTDDFSFTGSSAGVNHPAQFVQGGTFTEGTPNNNNNNNVVAGINSYKNDDRVLSLYPNPAANQVNLQLTTENSENTQVEIYNISGAKMLAQPASLNSGKNTISLDISSLIAGNYFVTVKTGEGVFTKRFARVQ